MSILSSLMDLVDEDDASWFVAKNPVINPVDVRFDYHVASAINVPDAT